jgi:type IX secretion system PorP/SprF family membrane protein
MSTIQPTIDFNAGILYHYEDDLSRVYAGFSMYHITRPRQTVMDDPMSRIPYRYTANLGGMFLSGENLRFTLNGLWNQQAKASEFTAGGAVGYDLGEKNTFYLGAWYRVKDSFYPYVSYVRNGMQFGVTFDLLTSALKRLRLATEAWSSPSCSTNPATICSSVRCLGIIEWHLNLDDSNVVFGPCELQKEIGSMLK